MEDPEIRFHSGIPVGHKFLAFLLAAAVAGAGCAWLIWKSTRSASAAVLAFNLTLAQQLDSGIASAPHPAIALANLMLNDQTVARLAKQARVASSTPAGQIGEFRSSLQFAETPAQQLEVRFQSGDGSQSIAVANEVAHVLAAWTPAAAAATTPPPPAQAATPPAPQPAPVAQGQSHPAAAGSPASQAAPPAPPLSAALRKLGAHLTAMGQQVDRLSAGELRFTAVNRPPIPNRDSNRSSKAAFARRRERSRASIIPMPKSWPIRWSADGWMKSIRPSTRSSPAVLPQLASAARSSGANARS